MGHPKSARLIAIAGVVMTSLALVMLLLYWFSPKGVDSLTASWAAGAANLVTATELGTGFTQIDEGRGNPPLSTASISAFRRFQVRDASTHTLVLVAKYPSSEEASKALTVALTLHAWDSIDAGSSGATAVRTSTTTTTSTLHGGTNGSWLVLVVAEGSTTLSNAIGERVFVLQRRRLN